MYPTHSAVLHVIPKEESVADPEAFLVAVRLTVENWFAAQSGSPANTDSGSQPADGDTELRRVPLGNGQSSRGEIVEVVSSASQAWVWQAWIERPLPVDDACALPRYLRTDVQMRQLPGDGDPSVDMTGAVVVTIREQLAFETGVRPPSRQATTAPPCGLLGALFDGFRVFQGNIEWTRTYSAIHTQAQADRLYQSIADRHRTVPLVVCVGDESHGPPVDPGDLGSILFGTARVVHIARPRLTGRLRERIGEKHRAGWNVLRLYRPGYSANDDSGVHRFFRKQEVESTGIEAFPQWLSNYIRREETFSIVPDSIVRNQLRNAETRQSEQARNLIDSLLDDLTPHVGVVRLESLRDAVALLTAALETAQQHRAEAEALATSYAGDLDAIKHERHRLRDKVERLESHIRNATQTFLPEEETFPDPKTVKEAVEQVQSTIHDGELVFHERVTRQVARYRSGYSPLDVRDCLVAIRDVARRCRVDQGDGRTPADYFRERGLQLKNDISDTARQQFRADYELDIERNGTVERVLMGPHTDLSPRHRVYWYHDKEAARFVIGHIGDHLRDASTN
jgi:hypothetical protein